MKLKYITSARLPTSKAHGYQIAKMCEAFIENGLDVEILAPKRKNIEGDKFSAYYGLRQDVKIKYLFTLDWPIIFWYPLRFWLMALTFGLSLRLYLWRNGYDLLYLRENFLSLFVKDFIMEVHMLPRHLRFYHLWLLRRARAFSVLTSYIRQEILSHFPDKKCLVSPDGVDLEEFDIDSDKHRLRQKLGLPVDKKIILYTGSFYIYSWKGVDVVLDMAHYFDEDFLIVLVGGSEKDILEIKKSPFSENIRLIGQRPHREMPSFQKAADVLVLPNKSGDRLSEECTSPLKLFEYMASDTPIVASSLPSIREVLNPQNAILVAPDSSYELAQGIKKVFSSLSLSQEMAKQAKEDVLSYTWEQRAKKIIDKLF